MGLPRLQGAKRPDGKFTYWGVTGDFNLGESGRNAIDVYGVTLPPPPSPAAEGVGGDGLPVDDN